MSKDYTSKINHFLAERIVAVAGVSSKEKDVGHYIQEKFESSGYQCYAVNPKFAAENGYHKFASLKEIPVKPGAVMVCTKPEDTLKILDECYELNIKKVWIHSSINKGSWHPYAKFKAEQYGIELIERGCPMMFIKPDGFHKTIHWFMKIFGKLN